MALHREVSFAKGAPLAELDALHPIIADNPAPERVVEVKDKTFG